MSSINNTTTGKLPSKTSQKNSLTRKICHQSKVKQSSQSATNSLSNNESKKKPVSVEHVDFFNPKLNSSKVILRQIEKIEKMKPKEHLNIDQIKDVNKTGIQKKITKRLNFHFDENIYKDLVALNICDEENLLRKKKSIVIPKYIANSPRDIEPNLNDFYTDQTKIDQPMLLNIMKPKLEPIIKYNGKDIFNKIYKV